MRKRTLSKHYNYDFLENIDGLLDFYGDFKGSLSVYNILLNESQQFPNTLALKLRFDFMINNN